MNKNKWDMLCENTDFVEQVYFPDSIHRKQQMEITTNAINNLLKLKTGSEILDLCCGTGAISIPLAKNGYRLTCVDYSESMLNYAKRRAENENVEAVFMKMDVADLDMINKTYDAVFWLDVTFGSIGESSVADRNVLMAVFKRMKTGGIFLLEIYDYDYFSKMPYHKYKNASWESELTLLNNQKELYSKSKYTNGYVQEGRTRIYSNKDLILLLGECGFTNIKTSHDLWGNLPVSLDASMFVLCNRE